MLFVLVVVIHVLVCLVIIGLVLLQSGKGADIGSAFGGGGSQAVFGSMGTPTVLGKLTTAVAIVFMLTSFSLDVHVAPALVDDHARDGARREPGPGAGSGPGPAPAPAPARRPPPRAVAGSCARPEVACAQRRAPRSAGPARGLRRGAARAAATSRARSRTSPRHREPPADGDTFIEASIGDISGLIPSLTSDAASHQIGGLIYDGLVRYNKDLALDRRARRVLDVQPGLPEPDVQAAPERQVARRPAVHRRRRAVHVRDDDPPEDARRRSRRATSSSSVETPDPFTVHVRLRQEPYARASRRWSDYMLPKHLLEPYVAGGQLRESPQNRTRRSAPVPTGSRSGARARRSCWSPTLTTTAGRPHIGRVVFRVVPSQATIFLELKAKGVDYVRTLTAFQYVAPDRLPRVQEVLQQVQVPLGVLHVPRRST